MTFTARTETYVDKSSLTSPYDITVNKPTGTVDGDILFCFLCVRAVTPPTVDSVPSGWNLIATRLGATPNYRYYLYYKIAAGEGASWVWSFTATGKVRAVCSCYMGGDFDPDDPIDVWSDTGYIVSDFTLRAASMSVTKANSPLVFFGGVYHISTRTFTEPSVPAAWTKDDDAGSTTSDWWTIIASLLWSGSGPTGDMDAGISASDPNKHAFAVALNPPGGYPGPTPSAFNALEYDTEPPSAGWNKLAYLSEPPVPSSWNKLKYKP